MKQGLDGMLLEVASDDDEMTPLSSPLQSVRRSAQRSSSQEMLCSGIIDEDTSEASIPGLPTSCEDQIPPSLLDSRLSTKTAERAVEEEEREMRIMMDDNDDEDEEEEGDLRGIEGRGKGGGGIIQEEGGDDDDEEEEEGERTESKGIVKEENKSGKTSGTKEETIPRFFVMKSFSQYDIDVSMERNIWATQPHNERKLNDAFDVFSTYTLLFFQPFFTIQSL